jgi:hypothetical protein
MRLANVGAAYLQLLFLSKWHLPTGHHVCGLLHDSGANQLGLVSWGMHRRIHRYVRDPQVGIHAQGAG